MGGMDIKNVFVRMRLVIKSTLSAQLEWKSATGPAYTLSINGVDVEIVNASFLGVTIDET